jgi:hypothetical protein
VAEFPDWNRKRARSRIRAAKANALTPPRIPWGDRAQKIHQKIHQKNPSKKSIKKSQNGAVRSPILRSGVYAEEKMVKSSRSDAKLN